MEKECINESKFICPYVDPLIYSCDPHIDANLRNMSKLEHDSEELAVVPNPQIKSDLIKTLNSSLSNLYEFRRKAIFDLTAQIKQLNNRMQNTLKSFEKVIKQHLQLISQINATVYISKAKKSKLNEILLMEPEDSVESLENLIDIYDKSNFFIDDSGVVGRREGISYESNQMVLFRDDSTRIVKTNLSDFSSNLFDISLTDPKSRYITMCLIPGNSIFCYGNYPTPASSAFIIGMDNTVSHVIDAPHSLGLSGAIYCKDSIYIFGGYTPNNWYVDNAFKYSLLENKWENLKSMPVSSSFVSCIARKNKILLSGREHSKIYFYDTIENYYAELHDAQVMYRKIICGNNTNFYVIETAGNIYESNHSWEIWNIIGSTEIENTDLIGYKAQWQNKVYFAYHTHDLYEFDLKSKTIKKIKQI